jgi:riboflavin synthase
MGKIQGVRSAGTGKRMALTAEFVLAGTRVGDSIAVNGACLTPVSVSGHRFEVDVSPETLATTTLGMSGVGDRVNIERALRLSDRLDGHLVSGHIDGIGELRERSESGNAVLMSFTLPETLSRYIVVKGSVAVDGISLTVNRCRPGRFSVSVIPHTAASTTLALKKPGDGVNIETDILGKYVERFMSPGGRDRGEDPTGSRIDKDFLHRTGFA